MGTRGTEHDTSKPADLQDFIKRYTDPAQPADGSLLAQPKAESLWGGIGIPIPPFQAAIYTFSIPSMTISNTRSRHEDTVRGQATVAVSGQAPVTTTADLGDHNNGTFSGALSISGVHVANPTDAVVFNYAYLNAGNSDVGSVFRGLSKVGHDLSVAGMNAMNATASTSTAGAIISGSLLPLAGSILVTVAGWLVGEIGSALFANCDGPVASEQVVFRGQDLWNYTHSPIFANVNSYGHVTTHAGLDSPTGCGSNSVYDVNWMVKRE